MYEDILDEIISLETAFCDYGVVVVEGKLDLEATHARRVQMRLERKELPIYTE